MIDIIIPTYKNKQGLITTLQSIDWNNKNFIVTVVDDCSDLDYVDIQRQFPLVKNWIYLPKNVGPGMARQHGINSTAEPYLMFIDTGDTFISMNNIVPTVQNNQDTKVFMWYFTDGHNKSSKVNNHLHGKIYYRDFLQAYNITFDEKGSYANEDIGFNRTCRMITQYLEQLYNKVYWQEVKEELVYWRREDSNSLTLKNNGAFSYEKQNLGLAYNMIHSYDILNNITIDKKILLEDMSDIMAQMYFSYICTVVERPEFIQQSWDGAKLFYEKVYKHYKIPEDFIQMRCSQVISKVRKRFSPPFIINFRKFIIELDKNDNPPNIKK